MSLIAYHAYSDSFLFGLRPDPTLTVTQWADLKRMLPSKGSTEPGKYRSSRTPYMIEIMNNMSVFSGVQEQVTMKGTQLGFTCGGENWIGYIIDCVPGPTIMTLPTVELAERFSKQKLAPTIQETPCLREKVSEKRIKSSTNTILAKEFPGGILFLIGANSSAGFRQSSIRNLFMDDADGFTADAGGEGDPAELARKRTDSFGAKRKIWTNSTPTIKGASRIERGYNESSQAQFYIPCPHCGGVQTLEWGGVEADFGIRFMRDEDGQLIDVWYECRHCHRRIDEYQKTKMLEAGEWVHKYPDREIRGYQLSALYSPFGMFSWRDAVKSFLKAKGHPLRMQAWVNTVLGLPYEEKGEQPEWTVLKSRAEPYQYFTAPDGVKLITAGVDVQDDRLAVVVKGWGLAEESWLLWHGEIYGDTSILIGGPWDQLDLTLMRDFGGRRINLMYVDSGGHRTQEVYTYCRQRSPLVMAIKGAVGTGKPVLAGPPSKQDVDWNGTKITNGVLLQNIGTDTVKTTIYGRLKLIEKGPGYYHFPINASDEYYQQLTAEKKINEVDKKGYPVQKWIKIRPRNEVLDCEVYAYAAATKLGVFLLQPEDQAHRPRPTQPKTAPTHKNPQPKKFTRPKWLNR